MVRDSHFKADTADHAFVRLSNARAVMANRYTLRRSACLLASASALGLTTFQSACSDLASSLPDASVIGEWELIDLSSQSLPVEISAASYFVEGVEVTSRSYMTGAVLVIQPPGAVNHVFPAHVYLSSVDTAIGADGNVWAAQDTANFPPSGVGGGSWSIVGDEVQFAFECGESDPIRCRAFLLTAGDVLGDRLEVNGLLRTPAGSFHSERFSFRRIPATDCFFLCF